MKDDLHFLRLWDLYSPLLTVTQREITDLYFNYDLSLGEIAEQKGVSRQSVSDCLGKCRKQLETYEEKLKFAKALEELSLEYSAYMTETGRWIAKMRDKSPQVRTDLDELEERLNGVHKEFDAETMDVDDGKIVGKVFRGEE
ncbi:MAG: DNA-binding protein [Clostridiales bacterium]|nr:DNA-binding protein [Clostridiales bacterium]